MRYPVGQKEQTRRKILATASEMFRRNGHHASGVDKVMEGAGLTAGGFYTHFASKQELLAEALVEAGSESRQYVEKGIRSLSGREWVRKFLGRYFDRRHVERLDVMCPLVALAAEVSRADDAVKASFEGVVRKFQERLATNAVPGANLDKE